MVGMVGIFNATNIPPQQGTPSHPSGMFDFQISHTEIKENKEKTGGYLEVEFSSPAGRIPFRYNLWNNSPQAVEIANKQLSALCHAIGIFQLDFSNEAKALLGGRGRMEIGPQKNNPEYTEIKRVFDANGNEPGRSPGAAGAMPAQQPQQQPQQATPLQQQTNGGWGAQTPTAPAPAPQQVGGWQQPSQAPAQQQQPQQSPPNAPPWATR